MKFFMNYKLGERGGGWGPPTMKFFMNYKIGERGVQL